MTIYSVIIRLCAWAWSLFLGIEIIRSNVPIIAAFPLFGIIVLTEQFFSPSGTASINSLIACVILTFVGFFGIILAPVEQKLILVFEVLWLWILFTLVQKHTDIITKKNSQYEVETENLHLTINELKQKIYILPEEIDKYTKQIKNFLKLNSVATEVGSILNKEKLVEKTKIVGEMFFTHGSCTVALSTNTDDPVAHWVIENKYPLHVKNISADNLNVPENIKIEYTSSVAAPIEVLDKLAGYIQFKSNQTYSDEEFRLFLIFHSITQIAFTNSELFAQTEELAITDGLTGLFVHRFFKERLLEEFHRAKSYNLPLSLVMIDIDHFKTINDTFGHKAGDKVLQQLAQLLKKNVRETDIVARYGGEEFAILMPQTNPEDAFTATEKIRNFVKSETFLVETQEDKLLKNFERLKITISAGVGGITPEIEDITEFINNVDSALYEAKRSGRDRTVMYNV